MSERLDDDRFPIGGPRQPVYAFLKAHGFTMDSHGDKQWTRADGVRVNIYGSGARVSAFDKDGQQIADGRLAEVVEALAR
jgi:hypothetical protein